MTLRERPLMLVVDDDPSLRLMMQATLLRAGFDVEEACNCAEGLDAFVRLRPDLVLLDVMMPDGDGYSVCRAIRQLSYGQNVPIVMVTGLDDVDSINLAYQSGGTDFITKPISWAVVGHRMRYILRASHAMAELKQSERRNRALISSMPDLILRLDDAGDCLEHQLAPNTEWETLLSSGANGLGQVLVAEHRAAVQQAVKRTLTDRTVQSLEYETGDPENPTFLELRFAALDDAEVLAIVRDISERKRIENALRQWGTVFESISDAIVVMDAGRRILTVNRACLRMTGHDESDLIGQSSEILADPNHKESRLSHQIANLANEEGWQGETWTRRSNGSLFPTFTALTLVRNGEGDVVNYILILSDITERKNAEARIEYLAHRDPVTGLANRALFSYRLGGALVNSKRDGSRLAVLLIDLDRFKTINDSLGHGFGDKILKVVADRLESCLREGDMVSRQGGDEFAMLLVNVGSMEDVIAQSERILHRIDQPFAVEDQVLRLSVSIGVSIYPDDGDDGDSLLRNADVAMYLAKDRGRNNVQFFTPELNASALERLNIESLLRNCVDNNELELHYQPQIDIESGRVVGCEALIRWRSPELGLVMPNRFIGLAEETGLILPMGEWIIRTVCEQVKSWQRDGLPLVTVAVNISAIQFEQKNFVRNLIRQVQESGVDPHCLELELTESMVMRDVESVVGSLCELKDAGFKLAVDDFGTGYSSLSYLRRLPIDVLKIDQSFVRGMLEDRASLAIVETIVALAKAMGLRSIAEGVETSEELAYLRKLQCEHAQGYYFAKPMTADHMHAWLKQHNP